MEKAGFLESWKEISDYIKHSIKTCQRWEKEFGLPVHRIEGRAKSRIWAVAGELDQWVKEKLHIAESSKATHSIAVLPLRNLSGDPEQEYFAEGITEGLITELGQISEFRVISHQSVRQYKNSEMPAPHIARQLRVSMLVEGSVARHANRLQITVNLIAADPERHIWAHSYEGELIDAITVQREIVHAIAQQIQAGLTTYETARLTAVRTVLPEAYNFYFKGKASVRFSFLRSDIESALAYYEKALRVDPNFAPAYAEIAWCYGQLGQYSYAHPREAFTKLKEMANRALELDPSLVDGHAALGLAAYVFDWNWPEAERLFRHAVELNPNWHRVLFYYAQYLAIVGRPEEAIEMQRRLIDLDPISPESQWNLGWSFFWGCRYDESAAVFKELLKSSPQNHWLEMALGMAYLQKGIPEQALIICDRARSGVPLGIDAQFDCNTAYIYGRTGKKERAQEILAQMVRAHKDKLADATQIATIQLSLGNYDEAFAWLDRAFRERSPTLVFLKIAPFFKTKRNDPRYQALIRRMNFPE